jgi:hypothetical protein
MSAKRATVYFEPAVHKALRLKAAASERTISEVVNESVRLALSEDAEDLEAFDDRRKERAIPFEAVVRDLKRRGLL